MQKFEEMTYLFVRRDSDMCVWPTAHRNNYRKAVYEGPNCERKQKF